MLSNSIKSSYFLNKVCSYKFSQHRAFLTSDALTKAGFPDNLVRLNTKLNSIPRLSDCSNNTQIVLSTKNLSSRKFTTSSSLSYSQEEARRNPQVLSDDEDVEEEENYNNNTSPSSSSFRNFSSGDYRATLAHYGALSAIQGFNPKMVLLIQDLDDGKKFIVKGDTKPNKQKIKELGGRWNQMASGWTFSLERKEEVIKGLKEVATVQEIEPDSGDEDEEEEEEPAAKKPKKEEKKTSSASDDTNTKFFELNKNGKRVGYSCFKTSGGREIRGIELRE